MSLQKTTGASGWVLVGNSVVLTAGTPVQISASSFADLLTAAEAAFAFFEARLHVVSGGATANSKVRVFLRGSDGTNMQPAPTSTYRETPIGVFTLSGAASGYFFQRELPLLDKNSTIYLDSSDDTLTVTLDIRAWTWADL